MLSDRFGDYRVRQVSRDDIIKQKIGLHKMESDLLLVGVVGFEPTEWRSQSPLPYHLATPQYKIFVFSPEYLNIISYNLLLVNSFLEKIQKKLFRILKKAFRYYIIVILGGKQGISAYSDFLPVGVTVSQRCPQKCCEGLVSERTLK